MPRTEEGEYELVLGNRQLLSIFFVVVVLLGAGFTGGYILGRNSAPATAEAVSAKTTPETATPVVLDPPPSVPKTDAAVSAKADPSPQAATPISTPKPEKPELPKAKPEAASAAARPYKFGPPPTGSLFIQIAAVGQADAETEATSLTKQGFSVWVAPNSKTPDLFSVLVGPFAEKADLAKAKANLQQLGFKKAFVKEIK